MDKIARAIGHAMVALLGLMAVIALVGTLYTSRD